MARLTLASLAERVTRLEERFEEVFANGNDEQQRRTDWALTVAFGVLIGVIVIAVMLLIATGGGG